MLPRLYGYSLLELLTCLALVSILSLLAIPAWQHWVEHQQTQAITQTLLRTLAYARQQAVLQQQSVIICPVATTTSQGCGNNWQSGWNVWLENGSLLQHFPSSTPLPISWQNLRHTQQIKILANGTAEGSNGTFYYGKTRLVINRGGRARVET